MAERLPSLDLIAGEVRSERKLMQHHADALDTKAGIVIGFAGAIVAVSLARVDALLIPGMVIAVCAALQCLVIFEPRRHPRSELRPLRNDFLRAEAGFTQLSILDAQISMVERQVDVLRQNESRLRRALIALAVAIALLATGTLVSTIGG